MIERNRDDRYKMYDKNTKQKLRQWIKTLRLLSNGTKSCEMAIETERIHQLRRRPPKQRRKNKYEATKDDYSVIYVRIILYK